MSEPVSVHPVGGVDYPRTFQELLEWFPDNASCLAYLERLRWPDGFVRPERELLSGVVELDEVFIGNESRGRAGDVKDRCAAMIAVESIPERKLGRVRIEIASTAGSADVLAFADRVIARGSLIKTDGASTFHKLPAMGYQHQFFAGTGSVEPAHVNLPACTWSGRCSTVVDRNVALRGIAGASGLLPGRIHLPVQPEGCCSTDCCNRPSTPTRIHSTSCAIPLPPLRSCSRLDSSSHPVPQFDRSDGLKRRAAI